MKSTESDLKARRLAMVETQIEGRGIRNAAVLKAMRSIPRHAFVPKDSIEDAYADHPLPIGGGQTISQPYIVAYMTEILQILPGHTVLEIGTGCGYQTAILAQLCRHVYTVEIVEALLLRAERTLGELGVTNVDFFCGDGSRGWPAPLKFDRILAAASPASIPPALVAQLQAGGRMILPVGTETQDLVLVEKTASGVQESRVLGVRFVPMVSTAPGA